MKWRFYNVDTSLHLEETLTKLAFRLTEIFSGLVSKAFEQCMVRARWRWQQLYLVATTISRVLLLFSWQGQYDRWHWGKLPQHETFEMAGTSTGRWQEKCSTYHATTNVKGWQVTLQHRRSLLGRDKTSLITIITERNAHMVFKNGFLGKVISFSKTKPTRFSTAGSIVYAYVLGREKGLAKRVPLYAHENVKTLKDTLIKLLQDTYFSLMQLSVPKLYTHDNDLLIKNCMIIFL